MGLVNSEEKNADYPKFAKLVVDWHHDRNLIKGTDSLQQMGKLLEEFSEVLAALMAKEEVRDISQDEVCTQLEKMVMQIYSNRRMGQCKLYKAEKEIADGLGDMDVVMLNILEREGISKTKSLKVAYSSIKDRKGRIINGTFVKEKDLPENQK